MTHIRQSGYFIGHLPGRVGYLVIVQVGLCMSLVIFISFVFCVSSRYFQFLVYVYFGFNFHRFHSFFSHFCIHVCGTLVGSVVTSVISTLVISELSPSMSFDS